MKPAANTPLFAGPFALGTFSAPGHDPFAGLVVPEGEVLGLGTTTRALLERWDEELPRLRALAADRASRADDWRPLEDLRVHAPSSPGRSSSRAPTTGSM